MPGREPPGGGTGGDAAAAAARLEAWLEGTSPGVAVVLGSGLGGLAERFEAPRSLAYADVPGWPAPGVEGHEGSLVLGRLGGVPALGLSGRAHLYEGVPPADLAVPPRALARIGVEVLVLSNAAGAVRRDFAPGELMLIVDHLDLTWRSPLAGPAPEGEPRWPDLHGCWDPGLGRLAREAARDRGTRLREGVYAAMLGPSYETPAEIRMLRRLGADAVGMSTVPEAIAARAAGLRCLGVSCLTNYAAGAGGGALSHEEVLETTSRAAGPFRDLVEDVVARWGARRAASPGR